MSNRIAVFNDGVVQQLSTPDILYEKPENSFVAKFIGENNTLNGVVREVNGSLCTVELDGGFGMVKALKINVNEVGEKTNYLLDQNVFQLIKQHLTPTIFQVKLKN